MDKPLYDSFHFKLQKRGSANNQNNYTADYWQSDIGQQMQKNAGALQNIIQNTMEEVAPQVEKLEKSMKQLRLEDSKAIGAQVAKMEKSELRQTVQNQMQEVQMTLGQGYGQVMQGMQQASRKVSRAQRKYMRDMENMQRKDY